MTFREILVFQLLCLAALCLRTAKVVQDGPRCSEIAMGRKGRAA